MIGDLLVDCLAVARLTRLVTTDELTRPARERLLARYPTAGNIVRDGVDGWLVYDTAPPYAERDGRRYDGQLLPPPRPPNPYALVLSTSSRVGYLLTCDWCSSIYVGLAAVVARRYAPRLWGPVARALAASEVAGLLAERTAN